MLICGANDVIGVGQYGYTAVYSGAGVLQAVLGYCSGTGTAGTGLQVLVLLVLSVYTAVLLATCIHLTSVHTAETREESTLSAQPLAAKMRAFAMISDI